MQQREARSSRLAAAREDIIKSEGHVRATIAWRTVAEQCKQIANHLWQSAPLNSAARANLTQWQLAVERDIGEERYVALHPVLRAGLYELVMMLDEHVAKLSTAHAKLMLLVSLSTIDCVARRPSADGCGLSHATRRPSGVRNSCGSGL